MPALDELLDPLFVALGRGHHQDELVLGLRQFFGDAEQQRCDKRIAPPLADGLEDHDGDGVAPARGEAARGAIRHIPELSDGALDCLAQLRAHGDAVAHHPGHRRGRHASQAPHVGERDRLLAMAGAALPVGWCAYPGTRLCVIRCHCHLLLTLRNRVADKRHPFAVGRPRRNVHGALAAIEIGNYFGCTAIQGHQA